MTASGNAPVSYTCPQCKAALSAKAQDAGQRRECPQCGKLVKVPGSPSRSAGRPPSSTSGAGRPASAIPHQGIANIAIVCPLCGTRMYATRDQVGKTMVCPDCLETVAVPATARPTRRPRPDTKTPPPEAKSPDTAATSPRKNVPADDDEDELKLSEPVVVPADRFLPKALSELIDRVSQTPEPEIEGGAREDHPPAATSPDVPVQFAFKCPTCDTMLYATESEIGTKRTCPDCFSQVEITRPRPKPRRVSPVVDADYADDNFALTEPVDLPAYQRHSDRGTGPKTMGEEALRRAEQELEQREKEESVLPAIPLWTGVFSFLADLPMLVRLVVSAVLLATLAKLTMLTVIWANTGGDAMAQFKGVVGSVGIVMMSLAVVGFLGNCCLTILQETASGNDKIDDWPDTTMSERLVESLAAVIAIFYSIMPGMVIVWVAATAGVPFSTSWLFLGVSLYLFFPVVQLSVLETGALSNPFSVPIIKSLSTEFLLWATFYVTSFAIALPVAIMIEALTFETPFLVLLVCGTAWAFAAFMYYRLLGRLAWACQVRPLQKGRPPEDDGDGEEARG